MRHQEMNIRATEVIRRAVFLSSPDSSLFLSLLSTLPIFVDQLRLPFTLSFILFAATTIGNTLDQYALREHRSAWYKHISLYPERFYSLRSITLNDDTTIHPGDLIGHLDLTQKLRPMKPNENLMAYVKEGMTSMEKSLQLLARACQSNNPKLSEIKAFSGLSHLSGPLAQRLGFEVRPIKNRLKRFITTRKSKQIVKKMAQNNLEWQKTAMNFKPARQAIISRSKLIELYGSV